MKALGVPVATLLALLLAIGCGGDAASRADRARGMDDDGSADDSRSSPGASAPVSGEIGEASEPSVRVPGNPDAVEDEVVRVLLEYCGDCHVGRGASADFGRVDDIDEMIEAGEIVPGNRLQSSLFSRLLDGTMPPDYIAERPSADEILFIGGFIDDLPR